ncbi:hypothetical protein GCM10025867_05750 [Frondihabitans sucicola]|uniref:DUF559 domain-containing protein n=1 Tax=Frondihabitans sucicola TaxID=1268041 RepID=A0ABM8GIX4_9MICO|nr:hypothetical protein [Frondihabitans sucicola]BDZ48334.1 hypothetical protein GCM10025867_05750 [Frondihabitans sucicola]
MNGIQTLVAEGGGILHKRQLVALGARDRQLTWAVRRGYVRRPRRGWYTTFAPSDPRYIAVRAGGRLTGLSALALLDAWQWDARPPITVSVPANASRFRRLKGVRVVWDDRELSERGSTSSVAPRDALREALLETTFEQAVSLLDWAVNCGLLDHDDIPAFVAGLPADIARIEAWVDGNSDSILESVVRTRLLQRGHDVRSQEVLPNGQRIDLVVDGAIGLELDGKTFHAETFESDRRKDLEIVLSGRSTLRLSYTMVRDDWERVLAAIDAALGNHRQGPTGRVGNSGSWPRVPRRGTRLWRLRPPGRRLQPELPAGVAAAEGAAGAAGAAGRGGTAARRGRHRRLGTIFG